MVSLEVNSKKNRYVLLFKNKTDYKLNAGY